MPNTWKSSTLKQEFVLTGKTDTWSSLDKKNLYEGEVARRVGDNEFALVKLTRKPADYKYDFVMWN